MSTKVRTSDRRLQVPADDSIFNIVDELRKQKTPMPSRAEMVRQVIIEAARAAGIAVDRAGGRR